MEHRYHRLILVIAVALSVLHGGDCEYCSTSKVEKCLAGLTEYASTNGGITETFDAKMLVKVCSIYDDASRCVRPFVKQCPDKVRVVWETFAGAFDYLCHDGFDLYIKHSACLSSRAVNESVQRCNSDNIQKIERLVSSSRSKSSLKEKLCGVMDNYKQCVIDGLSDCDQEAIDTMATLTDKSFVAVREYLGCGAMSTMAIGAICGAVLVIIVLGTVVRWYYRRTRQRQNTLGNQMSPIGSASYPTSTPMTNTTEQNQPLNPPKGDPAGYQYAPNGPYYPTTVPYAAPTGPYNPTTIPYAAPTGPYNPTTAPYAATTGPYNATTAPYASPTGPYNPTTAHYAAPTGPNNPTALPNTSDPPPPYKEKGSF